MIAVILSEAKDLTIAIHVHECFEDQRSEDNQGQLENFGSE
jgi:hypothetical protein